MPQKIIIVFISCISIALFTISYGGNMTAEKFSNKNLDQLTESDWASVTQKKIFFGHMSVGFNILDGVRDLQKEHPKLKWKIVESHQPETIEPATIIHSKIGKNFKPLAKMADFSNFLESGIGESVDIAVMKLCYLDILAETNLSSIFTEYQKTIDKLKEKYPDLTIIHCTVPLTKRERGPKSWIKKLLGRGVGVEENIKRNEYNKLLSNIYSDIDPILDIATIESTFPDGKRAVNVYKEKNFFSLVPEYTYDNGHLNEIGRQKVAEQLVLLISKIK